MRIFLVLICSLALACVAGGAQGKKGNKPAPQKKQGQSMQRAGPRGGGPGGGGPRYQQTKPSRQMTTTRGRPTGAGPQKAKGSQQVATPGGRRTAVTQPPSVTQKSAGGRSAGAGVQKTKKVKGAQQVTTAEGRPARGGPGAQKTKGGVSTAASRGGAAVQTSAKTYKAQRFNLQTKTRPTAVAGVNFQQNRRIQGSDRWVGSNYQVFRNYRSEWHDRNWWSSRYNRVVFAFGGWYAWNAGYWYPAWGYAPNAYYAYDGPIYGYNGLPPDQVIANVQSALQQQGYYQGQVDGLLGPQTRAAIADYQRANGLAETAAVDQPTLESLGMT